MNWARMYRDFFQDPNFGRLAETVKPVYVRLLLAFECDAGGRLVDEEGLLSAEELAWRLRAPAEEVDM